MLLPSPQDGATVCLDPRPAGGDGGAPRGVLALCALPSPYGLLVAAFGWGAALYQVPSRTVVLTVVRGEHPAPLPLALGDTQAMAAAAAALVVAVPPHELKSGEVAPEVDEVVGCVVVGGLLRWHAEAAAGGSGAGDAAPVLARRFHFSPGGIEPTITYGGRAAQTPSGWPEVGGGGGAEAEAELVRLASDGTHLLGTDARGAAYVWSARHGVLMARIDPPISASRGERPLAAAVLPAVLSAFDEWGRRVTRVVPPGALPVHAVGLRRGLPYADAKEDAERSCDLMLLEGGDAAGGGCVRTARLRWAAPADFADELARRDGPSRPAPPAPPPPQHDEPAGRAARQEDPLSNPSQSLAGFSEVLDDGTPSQRAPAFRY